ncbi:hypothetical protein B0H13DRAFT_2330783 [Mycena leptocephala]|nr:hypothetical protein B0H13DRAFT_2330783 [Mycena leptocephala]
MVYGLSPGKDDSTGLKVTNSGQIPTEYSVILRDREQLEPHLALLKEYIEARSVKAHDTVTFELVGVVPRLSAYSATLPPGVLRWVQSRPEVQEIGVRLANEIISL